MYDQRPSYSLMKSFILVLLLESNKQVMEVQQGMSRQNVEKILGKPDYRRFDGGGDLLVGYVISRTATEYYPQREKQDYMYIFHNRIVFNL